MLLSNQRQIIELNKFAYSPLGKAFEKQTKEQVGTIKLVDLSHKKDKLRQSEGILPKILMNDLIRAKFK